MYPRKLFVLTVHPTHYHDYFFREMIKDGQVDLEVYYLTNLLSKYPWKTQMRQGYVSHDCRLFLGVDWTFLKTIKNSDRSNAAFLIAGWEHPAKIAAILACIFYNRKFVIWTDTPNLNKKRSFIKSRLRSLWLKFISRKSFGIFSTGKPGVNGLIKLGVPATKAYNLPFFVDLDYFKPIKDEFVKNDTPVYFSSGRLDINHKGYDVAIEALARLKERNGCQFVYKIAGTGPDKDIIERLVEAKNLKNELDFLGWCEPNEILEQYRQCSFFIHSSHFDPFPNAVLEAMAVGCIVIASDAAGSATDRIEHGVNGFLFRDGNADELLGCLEHVLQLAQNHINEIGENARKTSKSFPVSKGLKLINSIYE